MKLFYTLVVLFAAFGFANVAHADCSSAATWSHPATDATIPTNAVVLIVGYGSDQATVQNAAKNGELSFKNATSTVKGIAAVRTGAYRETVVEVRASQPLTPGETYTMTVGKATLSWKVVQTSDTQAPVWKTIPSYQSYEQMEFGYGPAKSIVLAAELKGNETFVYYDVTLQDRSGAIHPRRDLQFRHVRVSLFLGLIDLGRAIGHEVGGGLRCPKPGAL